jgi:hypothetical protein
MKRSDVINTGPCHGGLSSPSAVVAISCRIAGANSNVAAANSRAASNNPSCGMDESTSLCPSCGGLMTLLGSFDVVAQVPRVEAPPGELVPPLQPTSQDDARVQGA